MNIPQFTIICDATSFDTLEAKCKELKIDTNPWAKETGIHMFNTDFRNENTLLMTVHDAMDSLAIKGNAYLVQFKTGNYGFVSYYGDFRDGFEIIK